MPASRTPLPGPFRAAAIVLIPSNAPIKSAHQTRLSSPAERSERKEAERGGAVAGERITPKTQVPPSLFLFDLHHEVDDLIALGDQHLMRHASGNMHDVTGGHDHRLTADDRRAAQFIGAGLFGVWH